MVTLRCAKLRVLLYATVPNWLWRGVGKTGGSLNIKPGNGTTEFGPGVSIDLTGDEVATAIYAWLVAHDVHVEGPRTVTVNGRYIETGHIYVDPSGRVVHDNKCTSGRG
jgi:hypothetical protein